MDQTKRPPQVGDRVRATHGGDATDIEAAINSVTANSVYLVMGTEHPVSPGTAEWTFDIPTLPIPNFKGTVGPGVYQNETGTYHRLEWYQECFGISIRRSRLVEVVEMVAKA